MFSVFPSSPLSRRFSIILILAGPTSNMAYILFSRARRSSQAEPRLCSRALENKIWAMLFVRPAKMRMMLNRRDNGEDGETENTQGRPDSSYSLHDN